MAPRRAAPVHNLASETLGQERTASGLRCASTFLLDQPFGCRRAIKWRLINLPKKIRDKNANYLFTHSLMFTVDWYTQTGINADVKLNDHRSIMAGIHAGDDVASWNRAAHPAAMLMVCWLSKSNNDTIYRDIDSLNGPPHSWFEGVGPGSANRWKRSCGWSRRSLPCRRRISSWRRCRKRLRPQETSERLPGRRRFQRRSRTWMDRGLG
jgi:hypothetical protein